MHSGLKGVVGDQRRMRVPWVEVDTERPVEWSRDGEPEPQLERHFRRARA